MLPRAESLLKILPQLRKKDQTEKTAEAEATTTVRAPEEAIQEALIRKEEAEATRANVVARADIEAEAPTAEAEALTAEEVRKNGAALAKNGNGMMNTTTTTVNSRPWSSSRSTAC